MFKAKVNELQSGVETSILPSGGSAVVCLKEFVGEAHFKLEKERKKLRNLGVVQIRKTSRLEVLNVSCAQLTTKAVSSRSLVSVLLLDKIFCQVNVCIHI